MAEIKRIAMLRAIHSHVREDASLSPKFQHRIQDYGRNGCKNHSEMKLGTRRFQGQLPIKQKHDRQNKKGEVKSEGPLIPLSYSHHSIVGGQERSIYVFIYYIFVPHSHTHRVPQGGSQQTRNKYNNIYLCAYGLLLSPSFPASSVPS